MIGGGPTGVELAGALAEMAHRTLKKDFRNVHSDEARVVLSQTQFEQYQKAVAGAMGGFGFRGAGAQGRPGGN